MRKRQTVTVILWPIILGIIAAVAAFSATNVFPANLDAIATSDAATVYVGSRAHWPTREIFVGSDAANVRLQGGWGVKYICKECSPATPPCLLDTGDFPQQVPPSYCVIEGDRCDWQPEACALAEAAEKEGR